MLNECDILDGIRQNNRIDQLIEVLKNKYNKLQFQVEVKTRHPAQTNLSVEDEINNFEKNWNWVLLLSMNNNEDNDLQIIIDVLYN